MEIFYGLNLKQSHLFYYQEKDGLVVGKLGGGKLVIFHKKNDLVDFEGALSPFYFILSDKERHNVLYLYRKHLEQNEYPPLSHHRWMFDGLPAAPFVDEG